MLISSLIRNILPIYPGKPLCATGFIVKVAIFLFLCWSYTWLPCQLYAQGLLGKEQQHAISSSLIGEWIANVGQNRIRLVIHKDGEFALGDIKGKYAVEGKALKLQSGQTKIEYQFELTSNQLTLSGGDITEPLKFSKLSGIADSRDWFSSLSARSVKSKLYRIALIFAVVVVCRGVLFLLRVLIRFVIYSESGPLKLIYRYHKNRTMTMYSLALNLSKYIIYLLALGFALTELGVNYTAYLASLSVIGLAIGFGSQGLVQDMVTGFFVIFENQFNVGDMVEIPPHTGIVEELGLRMTRLRNHLGQEVVIPNRNIATVGNYIKGAQQVNIDVAMVSQEAARKATAILQNVAGEISAQFKEIILSSPKVLDGISLATDEYFARLHISIWPQQQWVVEQQLVPRIREVLRREGFEIPNDRVVVSYHPREEHAVSRPRDSRRKPEDQQ